MGGWQRMLLGRLAKAERGELAVPVPIGYVRRPSGEVVLDPDEQARGSPDTEVFSATFS